MVKDDGMIELTRGKEKREKVKDVVPAYIYSYVGESSIIFLDLLLLPLCLINPRKLERLI